MSTQYSFASGLDEDGGNTLVLTREADNRTITLTGKDMEDLNEAIADRGDLVAEGSHDGNVDDLIKPFFDGAHTGNILEGWYIDGDLGSHMDCPVLCSVNAGDTTTFGLLAKVSTVGLTEEEQCQIAYLMSAAPKLLAACKEWVKRGKELNGMNIGPWGMAEEAIAFAHKGVGINDVTKQENTHA